MMRLKMFRVGGNGLAKSGRGTARVSSGKQIGTFTESSAWQDGYIQNNFSVSPAAGILSVPDSITVTDNLGGSATIPVTVNSRYS